ncbi:MAG TPA: protein-disulfide reductase DsbD domain-containing protein [Candidatus Acidoferrales bacterium]|nr:protein-disulfide reductase DsbD domain-containing protein [Candidatus Acidoferrales bacterium]
MPKHLAMRILPVVALAACAACLAGHSFVVAAGQSGAPRANTLVSASAYVSLEPVPRGKTFEIAVVLKVRDGFHINAHEVSGEYLIPTEITAELPAGFRSAAVSYPKGTLGKFEFSEDKLNVYQGSVTVRMKVEAQQSAPLGRQSLPLTLRYQACSNEACFPPVRLPVTAEFQVAERGAAARMVHAEIFSSRSR